MTGVPPDVDKGDLLHELGFGGSIELYESALQQAGLSNPRKPRISTAKRNAVEALLVSSFFRVCSRGDCTNRAPTLAGERTVVPAATQASCEVCGGSVNRGAIDLLVAAFTKVGWTRLCVVGGNPATREEIARLVDDRLELRLIDGTRARSQPEADADCAWAHLVILWSSTELAHKVSQRYIGKNVITCSRRGLAELAREAVTASKRSANRSADR
jgi:hypothetical protein